MNRIILIIFLFKISNAQNCNSNNFERVCYYSAWSGSINNLNSKPNLCTIIIYTYAKIDNGIFTGLWSNPLSSLKSNNPSLKIMIGVGGWGFGINDLRLLLKSETSRKAFIMEAVKFMRKLDFDGIDLDFKFSNINVTDLSQTPHSEEKRLFKSLCYEFKEYLDNESLGKPKLLFSASINSQKSDLAGYELNGISECLDFLNVLAFDLKSSNYEIASHHSPLYSGLNEEGELMYFNQDWVINYLITLGVKSEKIMLGIAFFGKAYTWSSDFKMIGAPAKFREASVGYKQICNHLKKGWKRIWTNDQKVPYVYKDNVIIGYDDIESIEYKINYTLRNKLGGVAVWSLDFEDTDSNACSQGEYPLLSRIHQLVINNQNECNKLSSFTSKTLIKSSTSKLTSSNSIYNNKLTTITLKQRNLSYLFRDLMAFKNHFSSSSSSSPFLFLSKYQLENLIFIFYFYFSLFFCFFLHI